MNMTHPNIQEAERFGKPVGEEPSTIRVTVETELVHGDCCFCHDKDKLCARLSGRLICDDCLSDPAELIGELLNHCIQSNQYMKIVQDSTLYKRVVELESRNHKLMTSLSAVEDSLKWAMKDAGMK